MGSGEGDEDDDDGYANKSHRGQVGRLIDFAREMKKVVSQPPPPWEEQNAEKRNECAASHCIVSPQTMGGAVFQRPC